MVNKHFIRKLFMFTALLFVFAGCSKTNSSSVIYADDAAFTIKADRTNLYINNSDYQSATLSLEGSTSLDASQLSKIQYKVLSNTCDGVLRDNVFTASVIGEALITAYIGPIKSSNDIKINALADSNVISTNLQKVLSDDDGIIFGQEYDIGIPAELVSNYELISDDDILFINDVGKLVVNGIGFGKLKFKNINETNYKEYDFTVRNTALVNSIKDYLVAKHIILSKSDTINNDMLLKIDQLDLANKLIDDKEGLFGLNNLTSLKILNLSHNELKDVSFLSTFDDLEELDLSNNAISSLPRFSNSNKLIKLNLANNDISSISQLQSLRHLKYLDLSNNKITNIKSISTSYSLESLILNNNPIQDFKDAVSDLNSLTELCVGNCFIPFSTIASLDYFNQLTSLDISGTSPNIGTIAQQLNIKKLIMRDCGLSTADIIKINDLTELEYLDISNNGINSDKYGEGLLSYYLRNLTYLGIGGNAFTTLPDFGNFAKIRTLDLTNSYSLRDISNLSGLLSVEELILDDCNSINVSSRDFIYIVDSLNSLAKLSLVNDFGFINRVAWESLLAKVENDGLVLRFLDKYEDKNSIYDSMRNVVFGLSAFIELSKTENDGSYTFDDQFFASSTSKKISRHLALYLQDEKDLDLITNYRFNIPSSLQRLDVFGNKDKTYRICFNLLERGEVPFTFGFYDFADVVTIDNSIIKAPTNSSVTLLGSGISKLSGGIAYSDPSPIINCYDLTICYANDENSLLTITGFAGQEGGNGRGTDSSDINSRRGYAGGSGGTAIKCHNITIEECKISIIGGKGGDGGRGGNSTAGPLAMGSWIPGGNGGDGGNGGTGIICSKYSIFDTSVVSGGDGGKGGAGGSWNHGIFGGSDGNPGSKGRLGTPIVNN